MNRTLIISITGFVGIIFCSFFIQQYLEKSSEMLLNDIKDLEVLIIMNKNELSNKVEQPLIEKWGKTKRIWSTLVDHSELDSIEEIIKRIEVLLNNTEEETELLVELNCLKFYLEHIPQKESFALENIF